MTGDARWLLTRLAVGITAAAVVGLWWAISKLLGY
jgi:hypothetical protein